MNTALLADVAARSQCALNGQPISCDELAQKAKPFIGIGIALILVLAVIFIAIFVFWLLMLIHAIQHKSPNRDTWIIVLVVSFVTGFSLVGALVYYFAEKKKAEAATPHEKPAPAAHPPNDASA